VSALGDDVPTDPPAVPYPTVPGSAGPGSAGVPDAAGPAHPAGRTVLDAADIARVLTRVAHEIIERNRGTTDVVVLGIQTRGVHLARRLAALVGSLGGGPVPVGALDISLYRDDVRLRPARALSETSVPAGGVDGKVVVLVDDVLYSGRTARAALTALDDIGRPRAVQLAVLVDRGHRELPIRADYVGRNLPTARHERVRVRSAGTDGQDAVVLLSGAATTGAPTGATGPAGEAP